MAITVFLKFLKKYFVLIALSSLMGGFFIGFASRYFPPNFESSMTLIVTREAQPQNSNYYSYDGYYSQQSAERFTDTVMGLIKDRAVVLEALIKSSISLKSNSIDSLSRRLKSRRASPQLISISYSDRNRSTSSIFIENLTKEVIKQVRLINDRGDRLITLSALEDKPLIEEKRFSSLIMGAVGFLLTLLIVTFIISSVMALKSL